MKNVFIIILRIYTIFYSNNELRFGYFFHAPKTVPKFKIFLMKKKIKRLLNLNFLYNLYKKPQ